jgi:hypothetical protein
VICTRFELIGGDFLLHVFRNWIEYLDAHHVVAVIEDQLSPLVRQQPSGMAALTLGLAIAGVPAARLRLWSVARFAAVAWVGASWNGLDWHGVPPARTGSFLLGLSARQVHLFMGFSLHMVAGSWTRAIGVALNLRAGNLRAKRQAKKGFRGLLL